jgi:hypothetical protein
LSHGGDVFPLKDFDGIVDSMSFINVEESTRQDNTLDLYFTTNPSLVKNCTTIPGLSDHAIVVVESDTKPQYCTTPRRKHFLFGKADWPSLKTKNV